MCMCYGKQRLQNDHAGMDETLSLYVTQRAKLTIFFFLVIIFCPFSTQFFLFPFLSVKMKIFNNTLVPAFMASLDLFAI